MEREKITHKRALVQAIQSLKWIQENRRQCAQRDGLFGILTAVASKAQTVKSELTSIISERENNNNPHANSTLAPAPTPAPATTTTTTTSTPPVSSSSVLRSAIPVQPAPPSASIRRNPTPSIRFSSPKSQAISKKIKAFNAIKKKLDNSFKEEAVIAAEVALQSEKHRELISVENRPIGDWSLSDARETVQRWREYDQTSIFVTNRAVFCVGMALIVATAELKKGTIKQTLETWLRGLGNPFSIGYARKMLKYAQLVRRFPKLKTSRVPWHEIGGAVTATTKYCLDEGFQEQRDQPVVTANEFVDDEADGSNNSGDDDNEVVDETADDEDLAFINDKTTNSGEPVEENNEENNE